MLSHPGKNRRVNIKRPFGPSATQPGSGGRNPSLDSFTVGELVREKINFLQKKKKEDSRGFWSEYEKSWESFFKTFTLDRVNELTQGRFVNTRVNGENRVY